MLREKAKREVEVEVSARKSREAMERSLRSLFFLSRRLGTGARAIAPLLIESAIPTRGLDTAASETAEIREQDAAGTREARGRPFAIKN